MAAASGRLFGVLATGSNAAVTVVRIDRHGTVRRTLSDPLAYYFSQLAAENQSLFIATTVIKRFTAASDELLRLDPSTLKVAARTSLPSGVFALASDPHDLWVALADRVLRLDPVSLAVEASYVVPGVTPPPLGSSSISSLARGPGGLWATFGDSRHISLYRFDPVSLAVRGRLDVPESGQGIDVVAGPESVWLTGEDFARRVTRSGRLSKSVLGPGLQGAAAQGRGLLALFWKGNNAETLAQVNEQGAVVARTDVGDAGARPVLDGRNVWLLRGLGLAHWVLVNPDSTDTRYQPTIITDSDRP